MVRQGKERALASSATVPGDEEATQQDTRWLNGVNRQLQVDAPSHQHDASRAAAAKRKAAALTGEEKAAAERARADRRNAAKRTMRADAAAKAKAAREQAAAAAESSAFARMIAELLQLLARSRSWTFPSGCYRRS